VSLPKVTVISTGLEVEHVYIEVSDQRPRKTKLENVYDAIKPLPPERVVVVLDGDDWLAHRRALSRVAEAHASGMLLTHGSFATTDGRRGFAAKYDANEEYRTAHWRLTHLKSFRAGLFQRIHPAHLRMPAQLLTEAPMAAEQLAHLGSADAGAAPWIHVADDMAMMIPMAEMGGRDRVLFIHDILAVYSEQTSWEVTATASQLAHQRAIVAYIRGLPKYARLDTL
jgi:hypothetical protein